MDGEPTSPATVKLNDVSVLTDIITSSSTTPPATLRNHAAQKYLSDLTSFSLDQLTAEPSSLQTQAHHLTSSLTSLTHTSYPTFISLHSTTHALTTSLTSLSSSLDSLLNASIPALEDCAAKWRDRTDGVLNERRKARTVLDQHEKIRDLLEIPLLIDTCVRNGYFSEALSLVAHAKSLAVLSTTPGSPPPLVVTSVLSEVHQSVVQMLLSLLSTLYEPNRKLPALWKAVNFLRKMDVFGPSSPFISAVPYLKAPPSLDVEKAFDFIGVDISNEEQIALALLLGRETCLISTLEVSKGDIMRITKNPNLDEREKEDLARYLKKYIDLWRESVSDIITQYSTIFLEKSTTSHAGSNSKGEDTPKSTDDEISRLHTLNMTYASRALTTHLFPVLAASLTSLSLSHLPSLLTQLTYCSSAFSRHGLDFRALISILFADAVAAVVSRDLKESANKFASKLETSPQHHHHHHSSSSNAPRSNVVERPSKWLVIPSAVMAPPLPKKPGQSAPTTPTTATATTSKSSDNDDLPHAPPQILASYPPLAQHTNDLLTILNSLRLLAPTSILPLLLQVLDDDVLGKCGTAFLGYGKTLRLREGVTNEDKMVLHAFGEVYFRVFAPFMRRALVEGVYGASVESVASPKRILSLAREWEGLKHYYVNSTNNNVE